MANNSSIEWTEATWNPVVGCKIVSPGCTNCYAMRMARRLELMGQTKYAGTTRISGKIAKWNGVVRVDSQALLVPLSWQRGRLIFVNSMSDLFHDEVPLSFIKDVFDIIRKTPQHTYQILTKRSGRLVEINPYLDWPPNAWMGVSVENKDFTYRIDDLRKTDAAIKFLSLEPLLGPLNALNLGGIDWVIAGGESGPNSRPVEVNWVRSIRDQCKLNGVPFHFKQWGGKNKKKNGRLLDDRVWNEMPVAHNIAKITT